MSRMGEFDFQCGGLDRRDAGSISGSHPWEPGSRIHSSSIISSCWIVVAWRRGAKARMNNE